jgi:translation initiation factor IF-3
MSFLSKGEEVLNRVVAECEGLGKNEGIPKMEGRYMRIMLTPVAPAKPKRAHDGSSPSAPKKEKSKQQTTASEAVETE